MGKISLLVRFSKEASLRVAEARVAPTNCSNRPSKLRANCLPVVLFAMLTISSNGNLTKFTVSIALFILSPCLPRRLLLSENFRGFRWLAFAFVGFVWFRLVLFLLSWTTLSTFGSSPFFCHKGLDWKAFRFASLFTGCPGLSGLLGSLSVRVTFRSFQILRLIFVPDRKNLRNGEICSLIHKSICSEISLLMHWGWPAG